MSKLIGQFVAVVAFCYILADQSDVQQFQCKRWNWKMKLLRLLPLLFAPQCSTKLLKSFFSNRKRIQTREPLALFLFHCEEQTPSSDKPATNAASSLMSLTLGKGTSVPSSSVVFWDACSNFLFASPLKQQSGATFACAHFSNLSWTLVDCRDF